MLELMTLDSRYDANAQGVRAMTFRGVSVAAGNEALLRAEAEVAGLQALGDDIPLGEIAAKWAHDGGCAFFVSVPKPRNQN